MPKWRFGSIMPDRLVLVPEGSSVLIFPSDALAEVRQALDWNETPTGYDSYGAPLYGHQEPEDG